MPQISQTLRAAGLLLAGFSGVVAAQGTATPARPATPAAPARPAATISAATARAASSLAVEVSGTVRGQIVSCPAALRVSPSAVCLYVQNAPAALRPLVRGKLGARALGDWRNTPSGKASSLLVSATPNGPVGAYVLLSALSDRETLVVVDAANPAVAQAASPTTAPTGVVKGQPYVLGRDLVGVVNVTSLGAGKFRLARGTDAPLTVTVGQKTAQLGSGNVELPLVPATDGRNLIFPLAGLRSLGCTLTPAGSNVTVACGTASVGLRPIVF
ncbi:hypothetical protein [Deinococcus planocerae]|uniref:hypothetical protein n=1 Tax=Deinococcus planocerae TaxID=1737569 RepID=UPI000C7F4721|nr:hypothetical protein [Deinococcus planocerae]